MFRTTTRIFVIFASLSLFELGVLALFFGRSVVLETENSIYDSLSHRVRIAALEASNSNAEVALIFLDGQTSRGSGNFPAGFSSAHLAHQLNELSLGDPRNAPSQTLVTQCQSESGTAHLCGFSAVPAMKAWAFDAIPKSSVAEVIKKIANELAGLAMALLLLALVLTYFVSHWALKPLQKFVRASKVVATGDFENVDLPLDRKDEVGELAYAFQKMITDLKEREKNLALSGVKLAHSARLASIGQMGASIAHEVKNPLTSMFGYAKILSQRSSDTETKEAAEIIMKEADRCNQILSQMLRFSRNDPHERRPYAMKDVIESTVALAKAEAKKSSIQISVSLNSDSVLTGSAQQVQQVLLNLIINAIHASRDASSQKPAASKIEIELTENHGTAVVRIIDHALGIPASVRDRIFDPFFTTKDKREGTGLGLSVAQDLIHEQGGSLSFKTIESEGTIFEVKLPSLTAAPTR